MILDHVQNQWILSWACTKNLCFYTFPKPFILILYFFLYFFILFYTFLKVFNTFASKSMKILRKSIKSWPESIKSSRKVWKCDLGTVQVVWITWIWTSWQSIQFRIPWKGLRSKSARDWEMKTWLWFREQVLPSSCKTCLRQRVSHNHKMLEW